LASPEIDRMLAFIVFQRSIRGMSVKSIRDYVNGAGMQLGSLAVKGKESGQIPDASKLMVGVGTPLSFVTDFWPGGFTWIRRGDTALKTPCRP
jgi:hypothetical protein